jgi:hypothetical protein
MQRSLSRRQCNAEHRQAGQVPRNDPDRDEEMLENAVRDVRPKFVASGGCEGAVFVDSGHASKARVIKPLTKPMVLPTQRAAI